MTEPAHPLDLRCPHCNAPATVTTRARRDDPARCNNCKRHSALVDGMLVPAQPVPQRGQA